MTDAHFHRHGFDTFLRVGESECRFFGLHPWQAEEAEVPGDLLARLEADPAAGVGEIGLDRLHTKVVSARQRAAFEAQLQIASEVARPVVLHGAKCWGEVVKACVPFQGRIPAFLFHGFSRSTGLLPDIFALNGFVSIGPALLNDHAVNYRDMAKDLPLERVLIETDEEFSDDEAGCTAQATRLAQIVTRLATLRGVSEAEIEAAVVANTKRFAEARR